MKKAGFTILIFTAAVLLGACNADPADKPDPNQVTVFDLSSDMSHIEGVGYHMNSSRDVSTCVRELLQRIIDGPDGGRIHSAIPEEISSVTYYIGNRTVGVNFNSAYEGVPQMRRILCQAAVVRTLCQLEDVDSVSFSVDNVPVCDSKGVPIGLLTPESFVENDGSMINAYERAELHLFFASEDGKELVEKIETVTYNSNISMDRLVVDNIISGPGSADVYPTVNPSTVVNSVTTVDGICYVNLSSDFLNRTNNVSDEVLIYSIVNSLTYLDNVNKVQILVDGSVDEQLGEYGLSTVFERDLSI